MATTFDKEDDGRENLEKDEGSTVAHFFKRSWSLWKNPTFLLILTVDSLAWIAMFVPYVHLVERAR